MSFLYISKNELPLCKEICCDLLSCHYPSKDFWLLLSYHCLRKDVDRCWASTAWAKILRLTGLPHCMNMDVDSSLVCTAWISMLTLAELSLPEKEFWDLLSRQSWANILTLAELSLPEQGCWNLLSCHCLLNDVESCWPSSGRGRILKLTEQPHCKQGCCTLLEFPLSEWGTCHILREKPGEEW